MQRGHAGEAMRLAAAQHPHSQGFHLIRRVMTEQKVQNPGLTACVGQNLIAHDPSPFRQRRAVLQVRERQQAAAAMPGR